MAVRESIRLWRRRRVPPPPECIQSPCPARADSPRVAPRTPAMPDPLHLSVPAGTHLPSVVNAIIEIPKGRRNKFEVDKRTGLIRLDRYLYSSSHYPGDYGFIPQTLAEDGDALDILVMVNEPTFSGCLIEARVVGLFRMRDRGLNDFKVLGVPHTDPLFGEYKDLRSEE